MSATDISLTINLCNSINSEKHHPQNKFQSDSTDLTNLEQRPFAEETKIKSSKSLPTKVFENSRSSDSGKSSSCSPILLDCSFDSGIAGVLLDSNNMQLHKRIQQCQCILLALERDREYFFTIRNRLSKITNRKKKESNENEFFCNVCCAEINPEDEKTFVKCYVCQKYICRSIKCADWLPKSAQWECELCQSSKESLAQTSSWVADQITFHQEKLIHPPRARSEIYIPISECNDSSIHFESVSQIGANSTAITAEQKLKIREYVEEVVAKLLGGNLDTIAVNQLSKSENYLPNPKGENSHNGRLSRESVPMKSNGHDLTDISETRLRQMIQKIIAETMSLPPLSNGHAVSEISLDRHSKVADNRSLSNGYHPRHRTEHYFEPTIYQDLLATAVLNKIVDKQLNNEAGIIGDDGDGVGGCGDGNENDANEVNANIRHTTDCDQNMNMEKLSTSSGSSVDPRSDCSYPEIEQILNTNDDKSSELLRNSDRDSVMSDYLASHLIPLPDLNAMATESDEDDYMSVTSSAVGDGTWEKNWLFKKKRTTLSGSVTANSVGMLVPDPKEDVRAQIGDKTTDEISDLSELGSDTDDSLDSLRSKLEPINDRLINKHLIGGQNNKMVLDELIERSSMISNTLPNNQDPTYTDTCNEHVIDATPKTEAINDNVTQQTNAMEQKVSLLLQDPNSNTLTASDDNTESVGCIGFSAIEIIEPCPDTPSVVEILAAMALGPMLAVPSGDQPATLTVSDYNAFTDLKELALAEIKARALELTPRNLDVIPEEPGDVTNQTENLTDSHESNSLIDQEKNYTKTENFIIDNNLNSSQISFTISEPEACDTKISNIQLPENFDHAMNEIITNSSTLISTKSDLDNSHLDMDENTVTEELNQMISQEQQASINDKIELVYSKSNIENNEQTSNKTTYEINSGMHLKDVTLSVNEKSNNENNINDDYLKENSTQQNVVILDQIESGRSELAESISQEQPFETQQEDNKIISVNHLSETPLEDKSNSTNNHALTLCLEQSVQNLLVKKHNSVETQTEPNKEISIEEISEVPSSFEISLNDTEDSGLILPEKLSEIPLEYKLDFDKNVIEPIIEEAISFDKTILKQETIETNSEITDVTKNEKSSEISFKDIPNLTYNKTSSVSTEFANDSVTKEQFGETQIEIDTTDSTLERDIESKIEENTLTKQLAVVDEQIPKETHFETQTEDILNSMNNKDTLSYRENCLQLQREKGTLNQPIESQPDDFSESMNNKESYLSLEPSMQYTNKEDILVKKLVVVDETEQPNEIHAVDTLESIKTEDIFLCLEVNSLTEQPAASDEEMSKDGHLEIHSDKTPDSTNVKVYSIGSALSIEECTSHAQSTDSKTQTSETIPEDVSNFEQEKTMSGEQSNEVYEKMSKDQPTQIPAEETGRMMPAFPKHSVKSISVECPSVEQPAKDNIIVSEEQSKIINEIVSKAQKIETQPGTNSDNIETDDASAEQSTKIWEDSLDFIKKEDLSTKTQNSSKCQNRNVESKTDECTLVKKSNEENSETFPESISIFTNVEPIEQYKSENFSTGLCRSEELKSEKKPSTENVAVNVEENSEVKQPETQADDSLNPISEVSLNFSEHHPEKDFEKSVHCNKTSLASIDPSTQSEMGDGSTADEQSKVGDNLAFIEQTSETLQESTTGAFIETKQNSIGKCTLYEHLKVNGEKISEEHSSEVNTSDSANNETSPGFSKVIVQYKIGDTASHKVSTIIHETISNEMQCETLAENILEFAKNENSYTSQESCVVYRTECSFPAKVVEYITYTYTNENQTENILNSDSLECTSSDPSEVIVEEITDSSETKTVGPLEMTENDDTLICPERIAEYKIDKCTSTERLTAEVEISHNIPENSIESSVESKTKECTSADLSTVLLEKITNNQPFEIQPENNLDSMKNEDTSSYSEHSVESKTEDYTSAVISAVFVGQITNLTETKDTLDLMNNDYSSACQERSVESKSEDCISSEHSVVVTVHLENTVESTNNENISPTSEHSAVFIEQITNGQICETQPEKTLNDIENERTSACSEHSVECKTDEVTSVKHSTGVVEQRSEQFSENCPEDTLGSKKNEDTLTCAELSVGSKTAECSSAETLGENALDGMKNEDNSTCICKSKGYTSAEHLTVVDEQITNDQLFETQTQNTLEYMKNEDSSVQDSVAAIEQIANDQLCETEPENTLDFKKNEETSMCPGYSEESKTEECTSVEHSREVAKKNTNEQISGIQTGSPFDCMKKEFSLSEDSAKVAEPIKNKQFSESPPENNLDSMKSKNTHENPEHDLESKSVGYITDEQKNEERMCPGYSEESKTEECTSVEHSIVVDKKNTNEQISGIQTGSPFDCIKKEFSLSEDSAKVAEPIKNEQFSESPPENNLDSMKIKNTHENPEHDLESKNVGYITDEHSVEDVALVTYQQPLEIQPGDALHSTNISSQSEESNSAEHSTVVIEQITKEQPSETQHENTLDSMNKESVCQERSMESKIEKWPSAEVDAQITNQQPSDTQTEDTLHFTKNDSQSEETTVVIEQITNEQLSDIQSKNTLEYTKKEDCSVGPEHSIQLKTGMCTSADFPSVSVEQITNEQPSETKAAEHLKVVIDQITKKQLSETEHKNILDSLKKEDCSVCPQRSMESKLEECPSTGPLVEVVVQITNQQISEILPEDIVQSTKNDSQGEESNSAKHSKVDIEQIKNKQSNSAEHSTVIVEHITNEQPSKTQSKNTLDSMKNGDCLTRPEQSVQLKTEVYTSADPSSVVVEQITNEQPSETNSAVHSIVVIAQITKEQISETQHVNTLDSVKKEVYSVCLERSMASKFEECPSVKDVPQIINQQSGEIQPKDILHSTENDSQNEESNSAEHSTVIVEHISNEQPSEIQHENTLDSMKNGDCLACPEQSMQLKTEVCTSSDPSSVVVEQITNEQPSENYSAEHSKVVVEQITKEQLSETQHVNTLDSVKEEEYSVCPERSMESKLEECPSKGLLVEVVAQITNEQPSETNTAEHSKVVVEQLTNEQSSETQPESNLYSMEKKDCSVCPEHSMESKLDECPSIKDVPEIINQQSAEIQPKDILHSTENDSQNDESNAAEHSTVIVEHISNEQPSEIQHENTLDSMKNGDCLACPEQSMQLKTEVCTSADLSSVVVEQIINEQPSETYSAEHSKVVVEQITKEQLSKTQHVNTLDSVKKEEHSVCPERSMESKLEECPSTGLLVEVVAQITNEQPSETNTAEHSKVVVEQLTNEQSSETQPESNLYSMEKKDCSVCPEHSMESKLINQQSAEIQPKDILHSTENDSQNEESNAAEHSTVIVEHISNEQPSEIQHENTLDSMKNGDCLACPEQSMQLKTEVCTSSDRPSVVVEQITNVLPSENQREVSSAENSAVVVEQINNNQLKKIHCLISPEHMAFKTKLSLTCSENEEEECISDEDSAEATEQILKYDFSETQPEMILNSKRNDDTSKCQEGDVKFNIMECSSDEYLTKDVEEIINVQTYETQVESFKHSTKNESKTEGTVVVARTTNDQISDTKPENTLEFTKNEETSCAEQSAKSKKEHCTSVKHALVIIEQISNELISQIQQKNEDSSASLESKTEECTSAENATAVIEEITSEQTAEMQMQNTLEATKNENCSTCTKCGIESKPEEFTSPDPSILVVETIINELTSETQHKSYNSYLETNAEECTSAKDSVAVIERIASEIISETQPQATLKSMKNVDCSISSEHSVEFQTEECTSSEHSALVFEQSTNDQPSETQLEDILHSVERTSAEHSTIFIEEFKRKQASNNQPENSLDSSAEFVQQATNDQSSETQLKNSLDSIKNTDSWACPETKAEKNFEESAEVTEQIENFQLLATQEENILVSKKYDGDLESKSKECTSDEFSSEVVQQILNEQPSENKLNNTLHSLKNEDFSACPEESEEYTFETQPEYTLESINNEYSLTCLETKTKECTSAEDTAIVFEQIKIKQNCKHQLQNTLDSMKNADCAGFPERSLESKSEECTSTEHSSIITELITNAQPSETKPENTIESMKNADCMESLEPKTEYLSKAQTNDILHSAESKTEKCASAKDSTVIAKQNNCEQPSETQLKNTLDSIKNEDYAACPERTFKSKTEEHTFADPSAVDFDQVKIEQTYETQLHSTLESMKNYDFSECHERFLESKAKVYSVEESKVFDEAMSKDQPIKTKHEHITDVIFETTIDNGESPVACSEISMRCSIGEGDINDESTVLNEQIFDGQSSRVQRQGISDSKKNEISSISVHSSTQSKTKKYTSVQHPIVYGKNSKEQFFEIQSNGTSDCMRNEDSPEQIAESKIEVINKTITEKQYFAAQTNEPSSDIPKPSLEAKTKENTTNKHTVVLTETQSEVTLDYTLCTKSSEETKTEGSMSVCLQPKLESKADECPLEKQSTVDDKIIAKQQDFTKMPAQNTSDFLELNLESKFEECYGAKQSEAVNIQTLEVITHSSNNETSLDSTHNTLPKIEGCTSAVHPTVAVLKTFEDHQFKVEMEPNDTIPNDILHEIPLEGISDLMNIKTLTISSKIQYKIRESTSDNKSIVCEEIIKQPSKNEPELKQIILKELSSDVLTESISDSKSCMQPTIEDNGTENKQEIALKVILDYTHNDISLTCQPKAENSNSSETQIESSELFSKGNSLKIQDLIVNSTPKEYTIKKQRKLSDTNSKDQSSESQAENKKQISKEQISEIPFGDTLDSTIHESSSENSVQYKAKECTSKTVNDKRFSKKHRSESQTKTNETISNERSTFHDETYLKDQILETQTEINNKIPNVQSSEMSFEGLSISTSSEASTKSSASGLQYKTEESTSVEQIAVLDETISKDLTSESEPETNKIISREESSEKLIDNFSTDPANNKKVLESSSEIHTKKEACLESKPINNNETQIESNLCQIPDVIDLPKEITTLNVMEDYVLFNDTPSITRQYTVVNIEGKEKRTEECHNKLSNSLSASEPNETSGSIAEREYKKWYNAVEMPNNPYAPEALKRRISGSQERFIDLPNISPIKDLNPLELLNTEKLDSDENATRESDYKRYSRDYYINSSLTTPQMSPARDVSVNVIKDNQEPSKEQLPTIEIEAKHDLYKAIPAQVEESGNLSSMEYTSERSIELETNDTTTTTSDSDTIKMYDIEKEQKIHNQKEETTNEEDKNKEGPTSLAFSKTESCGNVITPTRGTTPMAFKFLQPKRKLLEPSQVLSVDDDDEQQTVTSPLEKPVIEAEVAKALPSVKALARAFLMTTNSTQPEKLWLRKARTLSQGCKKRTYSPKRSLDIQMRTKQLPKLEDDITITSDLSSLETDSSSVGIELSSTPTDLTISAESSSNDAPAPGNISPVPVREGVLKNNIAFFENLKNK